MTQRGDRMPYIKTCKANAIPVLNKGGRCVTTAPTAIALAPRPNLCSIQVPRDSVKAYFNQSALEGYGGPKEGKYSYAKTFWLALQESAVEDTSHPMAWL